MAINVTPIPKLSDFAVPTISFGTAAAGTASTVIRSDATIAGVGAGTSVDNTIARFNGTAGQLQGYTSGAPTISDTGVMVRPGNPMFSAVLAGNINNITGAGTVYKVVYGGTELIDVGGNFDGTSTFTAPVTGVYSFSASVSGNDGVNSTSWYELQIVTNNYTFESGGHWYNLYTGNYGNWVTINGLAQMDAGHTAYVNLMVNNASGAGDVCDIKVDGTNFMGWLVG
jgi:hypothetical protein|tara:strand:- start:70 stop:750 length:681 start_codon:yes stop_codon:yes gene_type:complete